MKQKLIYSSHAGCGRGECSKIASKAKITQVSHGKLEPYHFKDVASQYIGSKNKKPFSMGMGHKLNVMLNPCSLFYISKLT